MGFRSFELDDDVDVDDGVWRNPLAISERKLERLRFAAFVKDESNKTVTANMNTVDFII